jgi:hypothetical protein
MPPLLWTEGRSAPTANRLEAISYIASEPHQATAAVHAAQVVLGMRVMADAHAPDVLPPGAPPFPLPAPLVPAARAAILGLWGGTVRAVRGAPRDPGGRQSTVEGSTLIGLIAAQACGALGGTARRERVWDQGDGMRRRRRRVDGARKPRAVCHRHELRAVAPRGSPHSWAPVFATIHVPSRIVIGNHIKRLIQFLFQRCCESRFHKCSIVTLLSSSRHRGLWTG